MSRNSLSVVLAFTFGLCSWASTANAVRGKFTISTRAGVKKAKPLLLAAKRLTKKLVGVERRALSQVVDVLEHHLEPGRSVDYRIDGKGVRIDLTDKEMIKRYGMRTSEGRLRRDSSYNNMSYTDYRTIVDSKALSRYAARHPELFAGMDLRDLRNVRYLRFDAYAKGRWDVSRNREIEQALRGRVVMYDRHGERVRSKGRSALMEGATLEGVDALFAEVGSTRTAKALRPPAGARKASALERKRVAKHFRELVPMLIAENNTHALSNLNRTLALMQHSSSTLFKVESLPDGQARLWVADDSRQLAYTVGKGRFGVRYVDGGYVGVDKRATLDAARFRAYLTKHMPELLAAYPALSDAKYLRYEGSHKTGRHRGISGPITLYDANLSRLHVSRTDATSLKLIDQASPAQARKLFEAISQ